MIPYYVSSTCSCHWKQNTDDYKRGAVRVRLALHNRNISSPHLHIFLVSRRVHTCHFFAFIWQSAPTQFHIFTSSSVTFTFSHFHIFSSAHVPCVFFPAISSLFLCLGRGRFPTNCANKPSRNATFSHGMRFAWQELT